MESNATADGNATKRKPKNPTWEHPKGSGIKIAQMPNKTAGKAYGDSFQVRVPAKLLGVPGKRDIRSFGTKEDALRFAEDRLVALKTHGTSFSAIPGPVQKQAAIAWGILNDHNQQTKLALNFIDVVRAGMAALSPTGGLRTFAEVAAELRDSKAARLKAGGLDVSTERSFRKRSERLEGTILGPKLISQILPSDIEKVLVSLSEAKSTRSAKAKTLSVRSVLNYRNILAELFRHAKAKQYSPTNPMEGLTKEDLKKLGGVKAERSTDTINILKVEEATRLLNAASEHGETGMLATLVIRLFCGFRTGEVSRLDWSEVHWIDAKPTIILPAGKAKKRRNREVEIPANALAWLKLCNPPSHGRIDPLSPKTYAKRVGRIARLAGMGEEDSSGNWLSHWEINDTRHSFGSYHYALHGDSTYTAAQMGHKSNDDQLFTSYRALVRKQDAEAYFAIVPPTTAGKVTAFPQTAATA